LTVDAKAVANQHGFELSAVLSSLAALTPMIADGLVVVDGPVVTMTATGEPLVRAMVAAFDLYLTADDAPLPPHARVL